MPVPTHGWFAACKVTEGNSFSLWQGDSCAGQEAPGGRIRFCEGTAVSGSGVATTPAVAAGLAGSVQIALMSRLGVFQALGFATLVTAVLAFALLLATRRSAAGYERALHQPWWMLMGGVMGLLIVFTVTYAGARIGVAATVGILIAGQLIMGAAIDRWGLFGSERIALHWPRVLGLLLLAVGAAFSLRK
jgi:transporter family-2 protein